MAASAVEIDEAAAIVGLISDGISCEEQYEECGADHKRACRGKPGLHVFATHANSNAQRLGEEEIEMRNHTAKSPTGQQAGGSLGPGNQWPGVDGNHSGGMLSSGNQSPGEAYDYRGPPIMGTDRQTALSLCSGG